MITVPLLHEIMPTAGQRADTFAPRLQAAADEFDISTPLRVAHWLAQIAHESMALRFTRELWGPTPAQLKYEGRRDLGNVAVGDGKFYLGRGLIQLTGRANYTRAAEALGIDCVINPGLLENPDNACRVAGWFWQTHGLNELADTDDAEAVTRRVNGGLNGLEDRKQYLARAKVALGL